MFDLDQFINEYVIKRDHSMFVDDMEANIDILRSKIEGKSVLVIGGTGSIGSAFIRTILPCDPAEFIVVDTNENALTELTRSLRSSSELGKHIPI